MSNPFLLAVRPSTSANKLANVVDKVGEVGSQIVTASAGLFCVPSPRSLFNLIPNPFVTDPSIDWTAANMAFTNFVAATHEASWSITTPATATLTSPKGRWHNLGDDHVANIRIRNAYGSGRTVRVTLRETRTDGTLGTTVIGAQTIPAGQTVDFTLTKTAIDSPWFDILIDNFGVDWNAGEIVTLFQPHVAPGIVKPAFFAYDTPASEAFPNPGLVSTDPYNTSYGRFDMGSASEVVWAFMPASRQYSLNPLFRNGEVGYTFTNIVAHAITNQYIKWATLGASRNDPSVANSRIGQTLTIPVGTVVNIHAIVFNESSTARDFAIRVGGVVQTTVTVGGKREGELIVSHTATGAATLFEVANVTGPIHSIWICYYFGVVDAKQIRIGPTPRLNAAGSDPALGAFTGAVDNSTWDSIEPSIDIVPASPQSPSLVFTYLHQGTLATLYWESPNVGAGTGIIRYVADMISGVGIALSALDPGFSAAKITQLWNGVTSTVLINDTPAGNLLTKTLYRWNAVTLKIDSNYSAVDHAASGVAASPPSALTTGPNIRIANKVAGGTPFNGYVASILIGHRWPSDAEWSALKALKSWTLDTPMALTGRMRVKRISSSRMRMRILGNGQEDA